MEEFGESNVKYNKLGSIGKDNWQRISTYSKLVLFGIISLKIPSLERNSSTTVSSMSLVFHSFCFFGDKQNCCQL
ncbi:putative indole-3-acetic acid-amido synthetase GH3.1 [Dirofilaria immitis]